VAESGKFGGPRVLQFGDRMAGNQPADSGHCARCEAMLADALDGTLGAEDQAFFDLHMQHCEPCAQLLADATRGAAWLEMLRNPAPEPPAELLQRILTQTGPMAEVGAAMTAPAAGYVPAYAVPGDLAQGARVIPFGRRTVAAVRRSSFGQLLMQPRLVMTAAMAFFSIALTMNITGINPLSLRASDLTPGSLKRDFYAANNRVVRYYEGLRVVYELESRVHELESTADNDTPAANEPQQGAQSTPANQPQPASGTPATQPDKATPAPQKQAPPARAHGNAGNSRHESLRQTHTQLLAKVQGEQLFRNSIAVRTGRTTV
jgi:hypothetical protein